MEGDGWKAMEGDGRRLVTLPQDERGGGEERRDERRGAEDLEPERLRGATGAAGEQAFEAASGSEGRWHVVATLGEVQAVSRARLVAVDLERLR